MRGQSVVERIVVGVDGSELSEAALRWAINEAIVRDAKVDVIRVWHEPPAVTPAAAVIASDLSELTRTSAERGLHAAVEHVVTESFAGRTVHVRPWLVHGYAGPVLVEAAKDADLLVVGTRGLGAFGRLILGSVSSHCLHHAPCPVVVIAHVAQNPAVGSPNGRAAQVS